jgi:hypothetical protein
MHSLFLVFNRLVLHPTMTSQTPARHQVRHVHDIPGSISDIRASQSTIKGPESVVSGMGDAPRAAAPASIARSNTSQYSAAAYSSLPPPPTVRTGFPQYQRSEAAASLLSNRGPPAYPDFLSLQETVLLQLQYAFAGLKDGFRWDYVIQMVTS